MDTLVNITNEIKKLSDVDFTSKARYKTVEILYFQLYELDRNVFMGNNSYSEKLRDAIFTLCAEMSYIRDLIDLHRSVDEKQKQILWTAIEEVLGFIADKECNLCTYLNNRCALQCEVCNNVIV